MSIEASAALNSRYTVEVAAAAKQQPAKGTGFCCYRYWQQRGACVMVALPPLVSVCFFAANAAFGTFRSFRQEECHSY